ncbi:ferritin-like domain-containing protein [uncultured Streptococcus sp.]|uniref:ferritin-like domain-containing protein n=1 Tax=uncultured Streptococcus sp. TaxID=83427 RepID=UPI002595EBF6|nr:ferritin-like domain-containing protein [uncultured Streptococcus sp.]
MGELAQKICKLEKEAIINMLNTAYAEEWLAYYQYWLGAKVAKGIERAEIAKELKEHGDEELKHAEWLADRIIQLGGSPLLDPNEWKEKAQCKYEAPKDGNTEILVSQNLVGERCAIARYQQICEKCKDQDIETFRISEKILKEELEHEQEMEDFLTDFKYY